ncbi:hypothetical protein [Maridesulfovibrio hydrothermalis]|uniref:Uncharacterized protein n=1 Tax=Maridesulfovibrio hydrothermalis AM13 = DSM 14728 TaxID=1121451 RepID=L0RGA1_9BACT|nr:hypothetical protein [Maridesulfovibrio hydrothermalis]CCO24591.1 conserved protein of unknown function [Maridesulfovibrio hydrothermalis AM13 = DSM 14728]
MWQDAFSKYTGKACDADVEAKGELYDLKSLEGLRVYLDHVHIKNCLLRPYFEQRNQYPVVDARELLPSFEVDLYEYKKLPGFSMVALERPLNYFQEIFQFDILHSPTLLNKSATAEACPLFESIRRTNIETFESRLPKRSHKDFQSEYGNTDISAIENYGKIIPYLLEVERGHVMAQDNSGKFYLSGVFSSFPSDLDTELKRFGIKIGKFKPGDNLLYEYNRLFVYTFLMELHGFPIVSERRTSSSLFARRLFRMGEKFMVRVLGQSDRTITSLFSHPKARHYPRVEKVALVQVSRDNKETIAGLKKGGFFVDEKKRIVILKVKYRQHKFNMENVREDRALSVYRQEVIHPFTGECTAQFNVIKDASSMTILLNDIVRGEYTGNIVYKRNELIQDTETHEKRLKFLFAWLSKHQRRIIGYSDEFYSGVVKVLDSYLLAPDNYEPFNDLSDLYQEVWSKYSYIQQARKLKTLEDLKERKYRGKSVTYLEMLQIMTGILNDLKFEIVNYFDKLVETTLNIGDRVLNDAYLRRKYISCPDEELTEYGLKIKKLYGRLVMLLDEFRSIRKSRSLYEEGASISGLI